jgi:hypothetical protein
VVCRGPLFQIRRSPSRCAEVRNAYGPTCLQCLTLKHSTIAFFLLATFPSHLLSERLWTPNDKRELMLPPRLKWILPTLGLLCGLRWFETDVSWLPIRSIFKGQAPFWTVWQ